MARSVSVFYNMCKTVFRIQVLLSGSGSNFFPQVRIWIGKKIRIGSGFKKKNWSKTESSKKKNFTPDPLKSNQRKSCGPHQIVNNIKIKNPRVFKVRISEKPRIHPDPDTKHWCTNWLYNFQGVPIFSRYIIYTNKIKILVDYDFSINF